MYNPSYLYPPLNSQNAITWVQGLEGAKSYQIPSNANVILMDSERDGIFYIKSADNIGMTSIRTFKYSEIKEDAQTSAYITKQELMEILKELKDESIISTTSKSKDKSNQEYGK